MGSDAPIYSSARKFLSHTSMSSFFELKRCERANFLFVLYSNTTASPGLKLQKRSISITVKDQNGTPRGSQCCRQKHCTATYTNTRGSSTNENTAREGAGEHHFPGAKGPVSRWGGCSRRWPGQDWVSGGFLSLESLEVVPVELEVAIGDVSLLVFEAFSGAF